MTNISQAEKNRALVFEVSGPSELPRETPHTSVSTRPIYLPFFIALCGIGLLFIPAMSARILGLAVLLLAVAPMFIIKKGTLLDLYSNSVFVHNPEEESSGILLRYEDIEQWYIESSDAFRLFFELADGETVSVDCFNGYAASKALNKVMPEKNKHERAINLFQSAQKKPEAKNEEQTKD